MLCYIDGEEFVLDHQGAGTYFGEVAVLLDGRRREVSVRAASFCSMYSFSSDSLSELLLMYPEVKVSMEQKMERRLIRWKLKRAGSHAIQRNRVKKLLEPQEAETKQRGFFGRRMGSRMGAKVGKGKGKPAQAVPPPAGGENSATHASGGGAGASANAAGRVGGGAARGSVGAGRATFLVGAPPAGADGAGGEAPPQAPSCGRSQTMRRCSLPTGLSVFSHSDGGVAQSDRASLRRQTTSFRRDSASNLLGLCGRPAARVQPNLLDASLDEIRQSQEDKARRSDWDDDEQRQRDLAELQRHSSHRLSRCSSGKGSGSSRSSGRSSTMGGKMNRFR